MQLENVHSLIDVQPVVDVLEEAADDARDEANDGGEPQAYVPGSGRDPHQTRDGALTRAHDTETALVLEVVYEDLFSTRANTILARWPICVTTKGRCRYQEI